MLYPLLEHFTLYQTDISTGLTPQMTLSLSHSHTHTHTHTHIVWIGRKNTYLFNEWRWFCVSPGVFYSSLPPLMLDWMVAVSS